MEGTEDSDDASLRGARRPLASVAPWTATGRKEITNLSTQAPFQRQRTTGQDFYEPREPLRSIWLTAYAYLIHGTTAPGMSVVHRDSRGACSRS